MAFFIRLIILLSFGHSILFAMQLSDSLRLDGYANIRFTNTDADEKKAEDSFEVSGGFQTRYQITDNFSTTAQVYFTESKQSNNINDYETDIKWLYLDYYLGYDTTIRGGVFQFPVFEASETGTIGYTTPWTENPIERYGAFGYDDFDGVEILKNFSLYEYDFLLQLSYGNSENELPTNDGDILNGKASGLKGITLKTSNDWFKLNVGYINATSDLTFPANAVGSSKAISADFSMYAVENQITLDNYSIKSGYIRSELEKIFPDEKRYYISLEYNINDFTPYIYYSNDQLIFKSNDTGPLNKKTLTNSKSEKYSIGTRYDISAFTALKFSYTYKIDTSSYDDFSEEKENYNIIAGTINVIF